MLFVPCSLDTSYCLTGPTLNFWQLEVMLIQNCSVQSLSCLKTSSWGNGTLPSSPAGLRAAVKGPGFPSPTAPVTWTWPGSQGLIVDSSGTIRAMMDLMIPTGTSSLFCFLRVWAKAWLGSDLLGPRRKIWTEPLTWQRTNVLLSGDVSRLANEGRHVAQEKVGTSRVVSNSPRQPCVHKCEKKHSFPHFILPRS